jgi:hypothetical protein
MLQKYMGKCRFIPSAEFEHFSGIVDGGGLPSRPTTTIQVALERLLVAGWPRYSTIEQQTKSLAVAGGHSKMNWHRRWKTVTELEDCWIHFEHRCLKSEPDSDTHFGLLSS